MKTQRKIRRYEKIADEFKGMGLKPGIWFRPLHDKEAEENHPEWLINRIVNGNETVKFLDPSNPEVAAYLRENMRRIIS